MMRVLVLLLLLLVSCQYAFWRHTHHMLPEMSIVPSVPGMATVDAMSLGDEQGFFRLLALQIQNSGDTFGRFTSLAKYDYTRLYQWFKLLDRLDNRSDYVPTMAAYYYSQTKDLKNLHLMVQYLMEYGKGREREKWWWLMQAAYLANHRLKDKDLALSIASPFVEMEDVPLWARQMAAFIHEQKGEMDDAYRIITTIAEHTEDLSAGELNFMRYFVEERLGKIDEILRQRAQEKSAQQDADTEDDSHRP